MLKTLVRIIAALLSVAGPAAAQSVLQSGTVTPGHAVRWCSNGVICDAGTAASGSLTSLGVTNNGGPGICVNSGPITGPYNRLCLSVSLSSPAQISVDNVGGATAQGLQFKINGSVQGFPVVSPLPVPVDNVPCFSTTSGNLKNCTDPHTVTPPTGDSSTRVATTAFVQTTTGSLSRTAPCGWRANIAFLSLTTTQFYIIGPGQFIVCNGDAWFASNVATTVASAYLGNIGQGGPASFNHNVVDISLYDGNGCTSPCVSTQGTNRTVTISSASPAVVSLTAHGLTTGRTVSFDSSASLPTNMANQTVYFVCATTITANSFKLSTTYSLAAAGTCNVNTASTGTGTITMNDGAVGGADPGDSGGPAAQANTNYHMMVLAKPLAGLTTWGVILSTRGCTSGPSGAVASAGWTLYSCAAWNFTNASTGNSAAFIYQFYKSVYYNQVARGTGTGSSGTGAPIVIATGPQAQWTGIGVAGLSPPDAGVYTIALTNTTPASMIALAPNVHWGNNTFCSTPSGPNIAPHCVVSPDEGQITLWATGAAATYSLIATIDGY